MGVSEQKDIQAPGMCGDGGMKDRKVSIKDFGKVYRKGMSHSEFLGILPDTLAARDLKEIAYRIVDARKNKRPVILGMGAHVIKVGLSPLIINMMERGFISCIAMNGAGAIHDVEIAEWGKTSEDVEIGLQNGTFGMERDAAEIINSAVKAAAPDLGMGAAIGTALLQRDPIYKKMSLLTMAQIFMVPVTVHVSIGTDTIHMHPSFCGAATGKASHNDFKRLARFVAHLEGGVFLNVGSAVILPEIFLKALNLARNSGAKVENLTTVNMDFIRHYRPSVNVVERPTALGGKGFHLIGHHEIMLPLLAAAIIEDM